MDNDPRHNQDTKPGPRKACVPSALYRLHQDKATGVFTVKDGRRVLRIYLNRGHAVFADGIDNEAQLLREIAVKRHLDPGRSAELRRIRETDPQSLGEVLLQDGLISESVWKKFLELKVRHILSAACRMKSPELGFSASGLEIPPRNLIDRNMVQLLLETVREMGDAGPFREWVSGGTAVLEPSGVSFREKKARIPLSPKEEMILSMIDGNLTIPDIINATGLDPDEVYPILRLLSCFGLVSKSEPKDEGDRGRKDYAPTIHLYLDLLRIIEANFRREAGREFEQVFERCKGELTGRAKAFCHDLRLAEDVREEVAAAVCKRFRRERGTTEGRLLLLSSFNKLVYLLIMAMKTVLGLGLTEKTLQEMMQVLDYVGKYGQDAELMDYVRKNLTDYLQQIRS